MSTSVAPDEKVQFTQATAGLYFFGALSALSVGAAVVHFAVTFEHFREYTLYGAFFLVISWAQLIWPAGLFWHPSRLRGRPWARQWQALWLGLGIAGNAIVLGIYIASRTVGLPFGPDLHHAESVGALDVVMPDRQDGPQVGGSLTRWHSHLTVCDGGKPTIAGFGVQLRGTCNSARWQDRYTSQMLHVWVVPYPGGVFSDDLSRAATNSAAQAALHHGQA